MFQFVEPVKKRHHEIEQELKNTINLLKVRYNIDISYDELKQKAEEIRLTTALDYVGAIREVRNRLIRQSEVTQ